jgi:hypothetical protein
LVELGERLVKDCLCGFIVNGGGFGDLGVGFRLVMFIGEVEGEVVICDVVSGGVLGCFGSFMGVGDVGILWVVEVVVELE